MLYNNQEEADTKVFLCANHVSAATPVIIHTVDTDIAIYSLYFQWSMNSNIYVKIGVKDRKRILDIRSLSEDLGEPICKSLPALHAFTGNDYTSAFHGIGKAKAMALLRKNDQYQISFSAIGENFVFDTLQFPNVEKFVCQLYGLHKCDNTDEARYLKFVRHKHAPAPQKLPPTRDVLLCHCKRVSYVTAIVKRSLHPLPDIPGIEKSFGWDVKDGKLSIQWMLRPPAPEEVLNLISCNCKKSKCQSNLCVCQNHGLKCTDLCNCSNCENEADEFDDGNCSSNSEDSEVEENEDGEENEE